MFQSPKLIVGHRPVSAAWSRDHFPPFINIGSPRFIGTIKRDALHYIHGHDLLIEQSFGGILYGLDCPFLQFPAGWNICSDHQTINVFIHLIQFPEDPGDCPLCRYLCALGVYRPRVSLTAYIYFPGNGSVYDVAPLAEWATKFQHDSIELVGMKTDAVKPITAVEAINALNTDFGKRAFRDG